METNQCTAQNSISALIVYPTPDFADFSYSRILTTLQHTIPQVFYFNKSKEPLKLNLS